jgi:hypothetical protein
VACREVFERERHRETIIVFFVFVRVDEGKRGGRRRGMFLDFGRRDGSDGGGFGRRFDAGRQVFVVVEVNVIWGGKEKGEWILIDVFGIFRRGIMKTQYGRRPGIPALQFVERHVFCLLDPGDRGDGGISGSRPVYVPFCVATVNARLTRSVEEAY